MPKIRRQNLPPALLDHLLDRIRSREVSADQPDCSPTGSIANGKYRTKDGSNVFPAMIVCGEGELGKIFLTANQTPTGTEIL
jgi:hypothetical protein